MIVLRWGFGAAGLALFLGAAAGAFDACAQEYVDEPVVEASGKLEGLVEEAFKVPATVRGHNVTFDARIWRPAGDGPFPVAILNHGGIQDAHRRSVYKTQ